MAIVLSRQALPTLDRQKYASAEGVRKAETACFGGEFMEKRRKTAPF